MPAEAPDGVVRPNADETGRSQRSRPVAQVSSCRLTAAEWSSFSAITLANQGPLAGDPQPSRGRALRRYLPTLGRLASRNRTRFETTLDGGQ